MAASTWRRLDPARPRVVSLEAAALRDRRGTDHGRAPTYLPHHFKEDRVEVLAAFIRDHPLATLVSLGDGALIATHLPMLWDPEPEPFGTLRGHIARPNTHGRAARGDVDSLAIFLGPQAYVSPSWYPAKREHGKVVPTWNYVAVHARGPLELIDDVGWLRAFVTRLTDVQERSFAEPWQVTDAPGSFIERMLGGIIGIEIPIRRLEGKWKLSQNRSADDRAGTIEGLRSRGDRESIALADAMVPSDGYGQAAGPRPDRGASR